MAKLTPANNLSVGSVSGNLSWYKKKTRLYFKENEPLVYKAQPLRGCVVKGDDLIAYAANAAHVPETTIRMAKDALPSHQLLLHAGASRAGASVGRIQDSGELEERQDFVGTGRGGDWHHPAQATPMVSEGVYRPTRQTVERVRDGEQGTEQVGACCSRPCPLTEVFG